MIFFKRYYVDTTEQVDCLPVTHEVHYAIRDAKLAQGVVTITIPAPEAGVTVGEALPAVREALVRAVAQWRAAAAEDGSPAADVAKDAKQRPANIAARVQSALIGRSVSLPFDHGRLLLDPYSDVLVIDCEPRRQRREVVMTVWGEAAPAPATEAAPEADGSVA